MTASMDDGSLVHDAQHGDTAALDDLLGAVRRAVHRYARTRLATYAGGGEAAEDVTQEVCVAVAAALPHWDDRGSPFGAFVYAIASNKVRDAQRAYSRTPFHVVDQLPDQTSHDPSPEALLEVRQDLDAALVLVAALPEQAGRIVMLRAHGLSASEVGERLGMKENAVRVAHHRALAKLRAAASG